MEDFGLEQKIEGMNVAAYISINVLCVIGCAYRK